MTSPSRTAIIYLIPSISWSIYRGVILLHYWMDNKHILVDKLYVTIHPIRAIQFRYYYDVTLPSCPLNLPLQVHLLLLLIVDDLTPPD